MRSPTPCLRRASASGCRQCDHKRHDRKRASRRGFPWHGRSGRWYTSRRAANTLLASRRRERRSGRARDRCRLRPEGGRAGARASASSTCFAVLPVAVFYGLGYALAVSIASMLAFNFFFLPPLHTLALTDSGNWVALAVFVVTAVVVSELATRARRRELRGGRGGRAPAERRGQDRGAARGQPRPALAADRDPRRRGRPRERLARARRRRPRGAARDDPPRDGAARAAGGEPARPLAARGGRRACAARAVAGRRARLARARRARRRRRPRRGLARRRGAARARGRGPARARARERARERAAVLVARGPGRARRQQHGRRRARDDRRPRPRSRRAESLERIFEPFEHGRAGGEGTGLGLAIARGFAEANGCRLWAEPRPGSAPSFTLALPSAAARPTLVR